MALGAQAVNVHVGTGRALLSAASSPYMFASNRVMMPTAFQTATGGVNTFSAQRIKFTSPPYPVYDLRVAFGAWYCVTSGNDTATEVALGNTWTLEGATVEYNGSYYFFKFSGAQAVSVASGTNVLSDAGSIPIVLPANSTFYIHVADAINAGDKRPQNAYRGQVSLGDGIAANSSSQAAFLTSNPPTSVSSTSYYGPYAIVAKGWMEAGKPPVALIVGDSIGQWQLEDIFLQSIRGARGWVGRGLDDNLTSTPIPYANYAIPSTSMLNVANTAGAFAFRYALLQSMNWPYTAIISQHGHNSTLGQFNTNFVPYLQFLKTMGNRKVVQTTITATTSSTDQWTSTANQTVTFSVSSQNTTILGAPSPVNAVIDMRSYFQDAGQKWLVSPFTTTLSANASINDTTISVAAAPPVASELVLEPGNANVEIIEVASVSGSGPFTVTLPGNEKVTKAHTSGIAIAEHYSPDGTHPTTGENIVNGQTGIIAAKNAGAFR